MTLPLTEDGRAALRAMADGDGRFLFNLVEEIARLPAASRAWTAASSRASCSAGRRSTTRARRATTI